MRRAAPPHASQTLRLPALNPPLLSAGLFALGTLGVLAAGVKGVRAPGSAEARLPVREALTPVAALLQAEDRGYVKVNWAKVNEDATAVARSTYEQLSAQSVSPRDVRAKLDELTSMNLPGAAGFAQGLLFTCGGSKGRMVALGTAAAGLFSLQSADFEPHLAELEARLGIKRPLPIGTRK